MVLARMEVGQSILVCSIINLFRESGTAFCSDSFKFSGWIKSPSFMNFIEQIMYRLYGYIKDW